MAVDYAHEAVDRRIERLEKRLSTEYRQALNELENEANSYLYKFRKEDRLMRLKVVHGDITKKQYIEWRQGKILYSKRYKEMINNLADSLTKCNVTASEFINKSLPYSFVESANFTAYTIEKAVTTASFSIYNVNAVNELLASKKLLLPKASVDIPKDMLWNRQKVNSAIAQGILQGDSIPKIAKRLRAVTDMNKASSFRNARTLHTAAESLGRRDTLKKAQKMGIDTMWQWIAVHDSRTRDAHRELDMQIKKINKPFVNSLGKIRFPSDPQAAPANVYNCRCGIRGYLPNHPYKESDYFDSEDYQEWKKGKKAYDNYLKGG